MIRCLFPPLFWSWLEYSIEYVTMILEYLFIPLSPLYESIIWLVESLIILSGSWFVFIYEMSTLSDDSWAEFEYEYGVVDH